MQTPVVTWLDQCAWLYDLRSSEIFFHLWRDEGTELCLGSIEGAQEILQQESSTNRVFNLQSLFGESDADQQQDEEEEDPELPDEERMQRAAALFARQDRRNALKSKVDDVVLSQKVVVEHLIPLARRRWNVLAKSIFNGSISIDDLGKTFGSFHVEGGDKGLREELVIMVPELDEAFFQALYDDLRPKTLTDTLGVFKRRMRNDLVDQAHAQIKDFLLLRKLSGWLPSVLNVHEVIARCSPDFFETPMTDDPFRELLVGAIANIRSLWREQTLKTISGLLASIKGVFTAFTTEQLDFVAGLGAAPELTEWLLAHKSTEEFNKLLQVVRPCTDEPRILSAVSMMSII